MSAAVLNPEVSEVASSAGRRKSHRVSRPPERFAAITSPATSSKRKRGADNDDSGVEADAPSSEEESSEGELDDEGMKERQRKRKTKGPGKRAAAKKPKTNGASVSLAMRPATNAKKTAKRPRKAAIRKSAMGEDEPEGLYADVFASSDRLEDVTANWITRFNQHEARAVAEIINLVLRAAGCDLRLDQDDIADPDNAPHRVVEMMEEFQSNDITDYPLIARVKDGGGQTFRNALHGFFVSLIQTIAQTDLLFDNPDLLENISVWLGAMSSTGNRPFRHTSTVASLAIITALASVAADIIENSAKRQRQSEAESKKSRVNKARVSAADKDIDQYTQKLQMVDSTLHDWFSVIYVHRYRDVDPKIRFDCVAALTDWIIAYPDKFFDGQHLRYLGWVLSDVHPQTRVEVLHQLARLFRDRDKLAGLKTFTERFRPRIVEIATRDAENSVRAAAVDLLDMLREEGFLEPDDIDSVGKLIFDTDQKVRKSVVGFFAENVNAAYEAIIEDMGGEEALTEALAPPGDDDEAYHNPRLEWLKLKCLVEQLLVYAEDGSDLPSQIETLPSGAEMGLIEAGIESRFSLAAQALYDAIPEMESWEVLAGYLLHDHSQSRRSRGGDDAESLLQRNSQLEEKHETVLLDILNAVVRLRLQRLAEILKDKKRTKAQRESDAEDQSDMARRLSLLIPQLLKKYGALPEAAALCLRLERELNLDIFQELRQNAAMSSLLDDINKQFLTHHSEQVLAEAIGSILHAQENEDFKETVQLKVQALWDDLINTFDTLRRGKDLSSRGNLNQNVLTGVSNIVLKMSQLAKASDASVLDEIAAPAKSKGKGKGKQAALDSPPIASLLQILERGVPNDRLDNDKQEVEDTLVRHTMSLLLIYFMWKSRDCAAHVEGSTSMPDEELTVLVERRDTCVASLMKIMDSRKGADDVRLDAANLLLDIYTMFRLLQAKKGKIAKTPKKTQGRRQNSENDDWEALCRDIDGATTKTLLQILTAEEILLAKFANKRLEEPDVDDDPIDPDDDPESDEEDADDEAARADKQRRTLLAERSLCLFGGRLVRAILAGSLDSNGSNAVRKRLERNRLKLTPTWKEIVNYLDLAKSSRKSKKPVQANKESNKLAKSKEIVVEDDSDEEEQNEVQGDEIEDEEMAEGDEDEVNGAENPAEGGQDADEESILGD